MVLTPTYHVFDLYQDHQDAMLLEQIEMDVPDYTFEGEKVPAVSSSASSKDGEILITFSNVHPRDSISVDVDVRGASVNDVKGCVLTADSLHAHNAFADPHAVEPQNFDDFSIQNSTLTVKLPPRSVVSLKLK